MGLSPPDPSVMVTVGIVGLSIVLLLVWPILLWWSHQEEGRLAASLRLFAVLAGWAALTAGLAGAGLFARTELRPPPLLLIPLGLLVGVGLIVRSPMGRSLAATPIWILVGVQSFRLPLELVMHQAALEGTMPAQMSFGSVGGRVGLNYDIVTGITAIALALALRFTQVPRVLVLIWNIVGFGLLFVIVAVSVLSTPVFARFGTSAETLNTWVLFAPFVWLPAVLVGSALLGHVLIFKALRATSIGSR